MIRTLLHQSYPLVERPNRTYGRADFVELVSLATGRRQSLAVASLTHPGLPDSDTFHLHLHHVKPSAVFEGFQRRLDDLLGLAGAFGWLEEAVDVAVDRHNEPVYGTVQPWMVGMAHKAGTNRAHAYLTSQRLGEPRLTLDLQLLNPLRSQHEALRDLLSSTLRRNPRVRRFLLDKGFYNQWDIALLLETRRDFIVPVPLDRGVRRHEDELYRRRERVSLGRFVATRRHRVGDPKRGPEIVQVFVWQPDAQQPSGERLFVYACPHEAAPEESAARAVAYRARWGIETGYRTIERLRLRTTSHVYSNRLFLSLIAVLLDVAWRLVRHARRQRRPAQSLSLPRFQFGLQSEATTLTA